MKDEITQSTKQASSTDVFLRICVFLFTVLLVIQVSLLQVYAQRTPPTGAPNDTSARMPTLQDLNDLLDSGSSPTLGSTFPEPTTGPTTVSGLPSINNIIPLLPNVDASNCATAADVISGKTYWGLCSGAGWGTLTGTNTDTLSPVPRTGQIDCWGTLSQTPCPGTGQDGEYQFGATASPRFTDNSDGTVTDNITGLIWLKNAGCFGSNSWINTLSNANGLASGTCGLTDGSSAGDWRLPNILELHSLGDFGIFPGNSLPNGHPFTNIAGTYWSSTTGSNTANALGVAFGGGAIISSIGKGTNSNTWPVR